MYGGVEVYTFSISALQGGERSASWLAGLSQGKEPPRTHRLGRWWDQEPVWTLSSRKRSLLLPEIQPRFPGRPARSLVTIPTEPSRLLSKCAYPLITCNKILCFYLPSYDTSVPPTSEVDNSASLEFLVVVNCKVQGSTGMVARRFI
jgi:hypothetical protein